MQIAHHLYVSLDVEIMDKGVGFFMDYMSLQMRW